MARHALVVGINRYHHLNPLQLPARDAEAIASRLEAQGEFHVTRLPERLVDGQVRIDPHAKVDVGELMRAIVELFKPKGAEHPDIGLLFVAGHGLQVEMGITEGFLAASDTHPNDGRYGMPLKWLRELLQSSPVRHQVVWLDTCHSGELLNFQEADPGTGSRCFIAASRSFELAYEETAGHNGVLTGALLRGLDPASRPDGIVTHLSLSDAVVTRLKGETQHPLVANSGEGIWLVRGQTEETVEREPTGRCPYKGLSYFDRDGDDPGDFFGRTALTDELIERVRTGDFLAILGVSGSGKSSVARAGLLYQLQLGERIGGSQHWPQIIMLPGSEPLTSLHAALLQQTEIDPTKAADLLKQPSAQVLAEILNPFSPREKGRGQEDATVGRISRQAHPPIGSGTTHQPDSKTTHRSSDAPVGLYDLREPQTGPQLRTLLLIDQFEELFTQTSLEDAQAFVALLLAALDQAQGQLCLVITLRADFFARCAQPEFADLARRIQDHQVTVLPMSEIELEQAIRQPARQTGLVVEDALVARMLAEVQDQPGALPLLQDALTELCQRGVADGALRLDDYKQLGGLTETLARRADALFDEQLSQDQQAAARWILIELTRLGEGAEDTRRRVAQSELVNQRFDAALIADTLTELARARVVVTSSLHPRDAESDAKPIATVEVAHEALIRHWPRLRTWLDENRDFQAWLRRLKAEAKEWQAGRREVMSGAELALAEEGSEQAKDLLDEIAADFIQASLAQREAQRLAEQRRLEDKLRVEEERREEKRRAEEELRDQRRQAEERQREEQRQAQSARERLRIRMARRIAQIALAGVLIAIGLAGWAWLERQNAQQTEQLRTKELFDSQLTHASLLAQGEDHAAARRVLGESAALDEQIPAERRHARNLLAGFSAIHGASADKIYEGAGAQLSGGVAVSPDGRWLAAAGERGTLVLFDARSGELVRRLEGHDPEAGQVGAVLSVVFDPQGRWLFSGGEDRRIIRWSVPAGEQLAEWQAAARVTALALSPDGSILASGGTDSDITLWDAASGERLRTLSGHWKSISDGDGLAFSSDGKRLVSASFDETAKIWEIESGEALHTLKWHDSGLVGVAFSPDDKLVATSGEDKRIVIWNAQTGQPLRLLTGHQNIVFDVEFSADGRRLWSASRDNTMRLWDVASGTSLRVYQGHQAGLWAVARHGGKLYSAANDGTVRRWPAATPDQWVWELDGEPKSAAVTPAGDRVAVGFGDGSLRLYGLPASPSPAGRGARGEGLGGRDEVGDAAGLDELDSKRQDGILPSVASSNVGLIVPDDQPDLRAELADAHGRRIMRIAFNADASLMATASHDRTVKLWRLEPGPDGPQPSLLHTLAGHSAPVHAVAFSPDGQILATAGYDGRIGLFEVASGEGELFEAHSECQSTGCVENVEFLNDGKNLMSVGYADRLIKIWNLTTRSPSLARELPKAQDMLLWASLRPDGRQLAAVGRENVVSLHELPPDPAAAAAQPRRLVGHEQTVFRAIYGPDGHQLATVGGNATVRLWDLASASELFALRLPTEIYVNGGPSLWDFDFQCTPKGECWIAVPLTMGRLALYRLPYERLPGGFGFTAESEGE